MRSSRVISVGAAVALLVMGGIANASPHVKPLPARAAALPLRAPKGYMIVLSAVINAPAGSQTFGSELCPTGKKVFGGGIFSSSGSVLVNQNASQPYGDGSGWAGYIDNASASASTFRVYAVCGKKPKGYKVVGATTSVASNSQATVTAPCPAKTKVLGGGGIMMDSGTLNGNLNSSIPVSGGWRVDGNNSGSFPDTTVTAWVVCGKGLKGVTDIAGSSVVNTAGVQTVAQVTCPTNTVPLGGGGISSSLATSVNINSSIPTSNGWLVDENNGSPSDATITAYVVCAK
jgi:hypothetical protein